MTLQERLDKANQLSVKLYLRRQEIEGQKQQIAKMAHDCDAQLLALDAQIGMLTELIAESAEKPKERRTRKPRLVESVGA